MPVDFGGRLAKLLGEEVHKILHEVTLTHEKILSYRKAVTFKLEFVKKYCNQRLIGHLVGVIDPLIQFCIGVYR